MGGVAPAATVASYLRCASLAMALLMSLALTVAPCTYTGRLAGRWWKQLAEIAGAIGTPHRHWIVRARQTGARTRKASGIDRLPVPQPASQTVTPSTPPSAAAGAAGAATHVVFRSVGMMVKVVCASWHATNAHENQQGIGTYPHPATAKPCPPSEHGHCGCPVAPAAHTSRGQVHACEVVGTWLECWQRGNISSGKNDALT